MKLTATSATLVLALTAAVNAAPAPFEGETALTKRDISAANELVVSMNDFVAKRDTMSADEIMKRENKIVTDVLSLIKNFGFAPQIILYLVSDPVFGPITQKTIVYLIQHGLINLGTLLKALNDSGLAVLVIKGLINDCQLYQEIFKIAEQYISDLIGKLKAKITGKREIEELESAEILLPEVEKRDAYDVLVSVMESLKTSGLADQVVQALVTDQGFLTFGADLIKQLFSSGALTIPQLISGPSASGLVPSLFKAFFNLGTLNDVITTALAAASGKCGGPVSGSVKSSATPTKSGTTPSSTGKGACRKRRRSYNY